MKFVSVRDLRVRPGTVWQWLREGDPLILTSNGKPFAMIAQTDEAHLVEDVVEFKRLRARAAVSRIREAARRTGTDRLSEEAIQAIIDDARLDERH